MIRAALTSLLARKLRLLLSAVAVVLGVGFVAGSLIFTDTLGRAFEGITEGTVGDVGWTMLELEFVVLSRHNPELTEMITGLRNEAAQSVAGVLQSLSADLGIHPEGEQAANAEPSQVKRAHHRQWHAHGVMLDQQSDASQADHRPHGVAHQRAELHQQRRCETVQQATAQSLCQHRAG